MSSSTLSQADVDAVLADLELDFKAAPALVAPVALKSDASTGKVTAIVSVTGVVDVVNDNIVPGAYTRTLSERNPKVCWHHDWKSPVGRVDHIEEWRPGDKRLPAQTKDGKPWPKAAGALVAEMTFNMKSDAGREAYEAVVFYTESGECEWSIGYQVPPGQASKDRAGIRHIKSLDLYEVSFVLFGAAPLSMTLSLKSAMTAWQVALSAATATGSEPDSDYLLKSMHLLADCEIDWTEVKAAADLMLAPTVDYAALSTQPDYSPEVKRKFTQDQRRSAAKRGNAMGDGSYPIENESDLRNAIQACGRAADPAAAKRHVMKRARALGRWDLIPDDWKTKTKSYLGEIFGDVEGKAAGGADQNRGQAENLRRWYVHGAGAALIRWGEDGDFMRCVAIASKHMDPERAKGYCNLRHQDATGAPPGHAPGEEKAKAKPKAKEDAQNALDDGTDEAVPGDGPKGEPMTDSGVMVALYPDPEAADAIAHDDGTEPEHLHVTLAYLGSVDDSTADGSSRLGDSTDRIVHAVQSAVAGMPNLTGTIGGIGKFPAGQDGEPTFVPVDSPGLSDLRERIASALHAAGCPAKAEHGFTPHMTLGYNLDDAEPVASTKVKFDKVHVVVGKDRTPVDLGTKHQVKGYDPAIEVGPHAGHLPPTPEGEVMEVKSDGNLPGTYEARLSAIAEAVRDVLSGDVINDEGRTYWGYVSVQGTWDNTVIATRYRPGGGGGDETETYEMTYEVDADGSVTVGTPRPVRLVTVPLPDEGYDDQESDDADLGPLAGALGDAVIAVKALLMAPGGETKAGRVLSGLNANRLKAAVQNLVMVLSQAGITIEDPTKPNESGDTTAARRGGDGSEFPDAATVIPDSTSPGVNSETVMVKAADVKDLLASIAVD